MENTKRIKRILKYYDKDVVFTDEFINELHVEAGEEASEINKNANDISRHKFIDNYVIELAKKNLFLLMRRSDLIKRPIPNKFSDDKLLNKTLSKIKKIREEFSKSF